MLMKPCTEEAAHPYGAIICPASRKSFSCSFARFVFCFCYIFCLVSSSKSNARLFEFSPGDVKRKEEAGPSSEGAIGILITL